MATTTDPCSCSNFQQLTVKHIHLKWNVDFVNKIISGKCSLEINVINDTDKLMLDIRDLHINGIQFDGQTSEYEITDNGALGQKLAVSLGRSVPKGSTGKVEIDYQTTEKGAMGLQFMEKEQTADKTHPYLFSQFQAIHARSVVPCMDTPAVKQTYSAEVSVPKGMTCLMSALNDGSDIDGDISNFKFSQPIPIPSYLLAIVVGALEKRSISDRCCVWSEPSVVDKAAWEFADTEKMLQTVEDLMGEYEWKRYDMVVLPPSFPFGGMENPCLTFVTPTLIAGDRSLTCVVAHEIAHSYMGNLVTNVNWEHFWLNEGFTVFLERKILGRLYGESTREFELIRGWERRLMSTINERFSPVHEYTKLIPSLNGVDPDEAFSPIPYEKGSALLLYLEQKLGNKEKFEAMLKAYVQKYRQKSITTDAFIEHLREYFADQLDVLNNIDFESWFYKPGVPPNKPHFNEELVEECRRLAHKWQSAPVETLGTDDVAAFNEMTTSRQIEVLNCIETGTSLTPERVSRLSDAYNLRKTQNNELRCPLILAGLKAKWTPIIDDALDFVQSNGRMKYIRPVYKQLFGWNESRQKAIDTFERNVPLMHPISVVCIRRLINETSD